ncbi:MAG: hypothetical protein ACI9WS_001988 [Paraglaciecola psychrophila]|jgi:hypothetical protein
MGWPVTVVKSLSQQLERHNFNGPVLVVTPNIPLLTAQLEPLKVSRLK